MNAILQHIFPQPPKTPPPQYPTCWRYKLAENEHWFYSEEDPLTFDDLADLNVVEIVALYEHPVK